MRFSQEFIESTRDAQGDEAANILIAANGEENRRDLLAKAKGQKAAFPRVARAAELGVLDIPAGLEEAGLDAFLTAQEASFKLLGVAADELPPAVEPPPLTPPPNPVTPPLGTPPGSQPWAPVAPGIQPPTEQLIESQLRDLMDGEGVVSGRADQDRRRQLVAALEIANQQPNGVALVEGIRSEYEDSEMFW